MNTNYEVAAETLPSLTSRLDKLNNRLAKIGAQTFTYSVGPMKTVADETNPNRVHAYHTVTLDTPAPTVNEWSFQATLVHTAEGNIVRALPGVTVPPVHRDGAPHCDHCQTNRLRRDTYIVRNLAGETKQVGSTCLGEFLGHKTPALLCAAVDCLFEAVEVCENAVHASQPASLTTFRIPLDRYLEFVAASVFQSNRYVTRKQVMADPNLVATATHAYTWMTHDHEPVIWPEPSDEAKKLARLAREFVLNKFAPALPGVGADAATLRDALLEQFSVRQDLSDFEHNLFSVARSEAIEPRLVGIAAYIIEFYRRSQPRTEAVQLNGGFQRIFDMFQTASKTLKFPAIQLADAGGNPIRLTLAGAASKNAGMIYVKGGRGGDYYGKITPQGRFFGTGACPATVEAQLRAFGDRPELIAANHGKVTGRCCFCNHALCDDRSIDVGYGPVCANNFGLKWGSHAKAESAVADQVAA